MIDPDEITTILSDEQIEFVQHRDDNGERWPIILSLGVISIELSPSGEHLRIRTGPIADAIKLSLESRFDLYPRAMDANDRLMIGCYCGTDQIDFEIGMAFPGDASLTTEQMMLGIRTVAAVACARELARFKDIFPAFDQ